MDKDFASIDRLLEFGMSMAIAQQMVSTMNTVMQESRVAGVESVVRHPLSKPYYVVVNGTQVGPLSETEMSQLIANNKVTSDTLVWKVGQISWDKALNIPEVNKLILLHQK